MENERERHEKQQTKTRWVLPIGENKHRIQAVLQEWQWIEFSKPRIGIGTETYSDAAEGPSCLKTRKDVVENAL